MENLSLKKIAEVVHGTCSCDRTVTGISIDSRTVKEGDLFVAIKGDRFDGHQYIKQALQAGAAAAISEIEAPEYDNVIVVEDTRKALRELAAHYRRLFYTFVVGVTGSVGKTSTKEMISTVLGFKNKTLKTKGNLNNDIGLPLTIMQLNCSYESAVIEMGMSNFGEISVLSKIAAPNVGVITNIGVSHMEILGSRENILKAKLEIIDGMNADAPLILNMDDDLLRTVGQLVEHPIISIGIKEYADIMASNIEQKDYSTEFDINFYGRTVHAAVPVIGEHNVYNALCAFAVGLMVDMDPATIVRAFLCYRNASMRQEIKEKNGIKSILDCYNASPDSMKAALSVLTSIPCTGKRIAVLGDMLELGEISEEQHFEVGKMVGCKWVDMLLCYGDMARHIKRGAIVVGMRNVLFFDNKKELADYIRANVVSGDVILYKASRGVALEEVVALVNQAGSKK